jgi:hypothetical protein
VPACTEANSTNADMSTSVRMLGCIEPV